MKSSHSETGLLDRIVIENFRSLRRADIPLGSKLVVLVGDNASGKTAILEAIAAALTPVMAILSGLNRKPATLDFQEFHRLPQLDEDGISAVERQVRLKAWTVDGPSWDLTFTLEDVRSLRVKAHRDPQDLEAVAQRFVRGDELPLIAYYGVARGYRLNDRHAARRYSTQHPFDSDRRAGYVDSLTARAVFDDVERWFEAYESLELRRQREAGPDARDPRLETIRRAVSQVVPEADNLRVIGLPPRLHADFRNRTESQTLPISSLSAGYLSLITIVMDMARRMAELNPDLPDPLHARGIVLIDEIDLHLHPRWQQEVVTALERTFPRIQFILTTHSPQVITTVDAENIRILTWREGEITVSPSGSMEGARSGRALGEVFGVEERPPASISPFVEALDLYRAEVQAGRWDGARAMTALQNLHKISPDDPELNAIAVERRRLSAVQDAAKS